MPCSGEFGTFSFKMRHQTSLILLLLAASVTLVFTADDPDDDDDDDSEEDTPTQYFSSEAKRTAEKLNSYIKRFKNSIYEYENYLVHNSEISTVFNEYRDAYESTKNTKCAGEEPPKSDEDETIMWNCMRYCKKKNTPDKLKALNNQVTKPESKVKELDDALKKNSETCAADQTACEKNKQKIVGEIDAIISENQIAILDTAVSEALTESKDVWKSCFDKEIKELQDELNDGIKEMNSCKNQQA